MSQILRTALFSFALLSAFEACSGGLTEVLNALDVSEGENASGCLMVEVTSNATFGNTRTTYKRIEIPVDFDITQLTVESLEQLEQVLCQ